MDKELLYNQSGIKDVTAYKAITSIDNARVNMNMTDTNKGEIWEVENGTETKCVVVLACYERYAATVMLQNQEPGSNAVRVRAHCIMYADAGRLGWTFYDKMVAFIRALTDDEETELRQAIGAALEIPVDEGPLESMAADANREIEGLQYEIAQLRKELAAANEVAENKAEELEEAANRVAELEKEKAAKEYTELPPCVSVEELITERMLREDLAAARREAEIYKGLYEDMLARALG